jgi:hypothetical protein
MIQDGPKCGEMFNIQKRSRRCRAAQRTTPWGA